MAEWQPIETVPTEDDHPILVFGYGKVGLATFDTKRGWSFWPRIIPEDGEGVLGVTVDAGLCVGCTHWMELPTPPEPLNG